MSELEGTTEFNRAHRTATQAMYRNYGVAWAKKAPEGASLPLPPPPPVSEPQLFMLSGSKGEEGWQVLETEIVSFELVGDLWVLRTEGDERVLINARSYDMLSMEPQ